MPSKSSSSPSSLLGKTHRPLVVIVGWLGSTPRLLRRYEALWQAQGCTIISYIPTPAMVVRAVVANESFSGDNFANVKVPRSWPHKQAGASSTSPPFVFSFSSKSSPSTMQEAAWQILAQIDNMTEAPFVYWHVFSNAGSFLWEQVLLILNSHDSNSNSTNNMTKGDNTHEQQQQEPSACPNIPEPVRIRLSKLRQRCVGVVFDSCPGKDLHNIDFAMQYCSRYERTITFLNAGWQWATYIKTPRQIERIKQREFEYLNNLRLDSWSLPQLYLYSHDDNLVSYEVVSSIVSDRQQMLGKDVIWGRMFPDSDHCAHYLKYTTEYTNLVADFVKHCLMKDTNQSKL